MKPIHYIRVSKADKKRPGLSPETQRDAIAAWARHSHVDAGDVVQDLGVSAGIPLGKRPGGKQLLAAIAAGCRAVVVMRLDRLFRRVDDGSYWLRRWNREGVTLYTVSESLDLAEPSGMLVAHMLLAAAEYEHQLAGQRTRAVRTSMKREGKRLGGTDPYGWTHDDSNHLVELDHEQKTRSRILRLSSFGNGPEKIASALNADGVPSRSGRPWTKAMVRSVLRGAGRRAARAAPGQTETAAGDESPAAA